MGRRACGDGGVAGEDGLREVGLALWADGDCGGMGVASYMPALLPAWGVRAGFGAKGRCAARLCHAWEAVLPLRPVSARLPCLWHPRLARSEQPRGPQDVHRDVPQTSSQALEGPLWPCCLPCPRRVLTLRPPALDSRALHTLSSTVTVLWSRSRPSSCPVGSFRWMHGAPRTQCSRPRGTVLGVDLTSPPHGDSLAWGL